jgi:hypothetical protein
VTATRIVAFEVAPADDEGFLRSHAAAGTLHRALRPDTAFRFVAIGPDARADTPFAAHAAAYEVVHSDGVPEGTEGVILIDLFEVPDGEDEGFQAGWHDARAALAGQRGYLGTRLHRSSAAADFRFVGVARWSSPLAFSRAVGQPDWQAVTALPFPSHPALYQVIR